MAKKKTVFDAGTTLLVLQIVVAAFLITLGLVGLIHWDSDPSRFGRGLTRAFGGTNNPFSLIVAIVELVAGLIVLAGAFARVRGRLLFAPVLAAAYGFLYAALRSEDYALLIGSLGLFAILAGVMILTRKVDWYRPGSQDRRQPG